MRWVFSQARVALAAVLIKVKPSGVSARQHAEALASKLRRLDEGWRKEAQDLQREVLRLRQELLMSRAAAAEAAGGNTWKRRHKVLYFQQRALLEVCRFRTSQQHLKSPGV